MVYLKEWSLSMAIFVSIKYWEIGYIGLTDPRSICHQEKVIRKK